MDFFSATQLLGYIAYAVSMTGAFQKNDKKLFLLFAASNALFSIHHFCWETSAPVCLKSSSAAECI